MTRLSRIQQQVFDCIKEHNDPNGLSSKYYYYMYCCSGKTDVLNQEAFDELLEELREEELLKISGKNSEDEPLYCLAKEEKLSVSEQRSQAFAAIQYEFQGLSPAKLAEIAKTEMMKFIPKCGMKDTNSIVQSLVLAATIGTEGKCPINPPEKALVNSTFGALVSNSMEFIYRMMEQPLDEQAFGMMTMFCDMGGKELGMSLLRFILAFAYADGDLSKQIAAKLESVFKPVLTD